MAVGDTRTDQDPPRDACLTHRPPSEDRAWRRADAGYRTCAACYDTMRSWLSLLAVDDDGRPNSIPALYALLNPRPGSTGDSSGIRTPGFGPRSPANDHIVAMRDVRSGVAVRPGDPRSAPAVLRAWVTYVWDERYDDEALDWPDYRVRRAALPFGVPEMAAWLDRQLDWITRHEVVADFHAELRAVHASLRAVGSRRSKVGRCPNTIDEGTTTRECSALLFAPLHGDVIRCYACDREWQRHEWLSLGDMLPSSRGSTPRAQATAAAR